MRFSFNWDELYDFMKDSDFILGDNTRMSKNVIDKDKQSQLDSIAKRFNHIYKNKIFPEPQARLTATSRLLGLDGRKMSKSYNNSIALSDTSKEIDKRVMSMFTDPQRIKRTDPGRPEVCNVYSYYRVFSDNGICSDVESECRSAKRGCTDCKKQFSCLLNDYLAPIQKRRSELLSDKKIIIEALEKGRAKAASVAKSTMNQVRGMIGL